MILIAESGSTKTQWCTVSPDRIEKLQNTPGINPLLLSNDEIEGIMRPVLAEIDILEIQSIYYYGAGCSSSLLKEKIRKAIYSIFHCNDIFIDTDLIAACLSLAGNTPAIIGLLGTGSNSCMWNGTAIEQKIPSLGFILGDEGGGVSIGKQLISDFLLNQMPQNLRINFIERYDISVENIHERVYQSQMPNRYLAGFAPFIENNITEPYCQKLLINQFDSFITRYILQYDKISVLKLHFCGSIAFVHQVQLQKICEKHNLTIGVIVKEPLEGLSSCLQRKIFG
jgi:glucosamine kinase